MIRRARNADSHLLSYACVIFGATFTVHDDNHGISCCHGFGRHSKCITKQMICDQPHGRRSFLGDEVGAWLGTPTTSHAQTGPFASSHLATLTASSNEAGFAAATTVVNATLKRNDQVTTSCGWLSRRRASGKGELSASVVESPH